MDQSRVRVREIDALRGLAALAVMAYHYTASFLITHSGPLLTEFRYGSQCVWLFFAISGFVILMTAERTERVVDFAVGRFGRLYPAYWVAVIFSFLLIRYSGGLTIGRSNSRLHALANLTMFQELFGIPDVDGSFWSLWVELTFYLLVGCLIAGRQLQRLGWILLALVLVQAIIVLSESIRSLPMAAAAIRFFPVLKFSEYFCLGVWSYKLSRRWDWHFIPVFLCLLGCAAAKQQFIAFLIISGLFLGAAHGRMPWLANRVFLYLGTISYSLYLLHQNLGQVVIRWLEMRGVNPNVAVIAAMAVSIGAATAVWFLVERPANDAIRSWWKRRKPAEAQHSPQSVAG